MTDRFTPGPWRVDITRREYSTAVLFDTRVTGGVRIRCVAAGICGTCYATKYEGVEKTRVLEYAVIEWLMGDSTGMSSKCMAFWLTWHKRGEDAHYPFDPSDLTRCLRLLQAAPQLRERLPEMAQLSPMWEVLVQRWPDLEASLLNEVGDLDWSKANRAPQTYATMRGIRDGVEPKP